MKYKITKQVDDEIEITFPVFIKRSNYYFAFLSEDTMISISDWSSGPILNLGKPTYSDFAEVVAGEQITEDDFQFAFQLAIDKLQKALPVAA